MNKVYFLFLIIFSSLIFSYALAVTGGPRGGSTTTPGLGQGELKLADFLGGKKGVLDCSGFYLLTQSGIDKYNFLTLQSEGMLDFKATMAGDIQPLEIQVKECGNTKRILVLGKRENEVKLVSLTENLNYQGDITLQGKN